MGVITGMCMVDGLSTYNYFISVSPPTESSSCLSTCWPCFVTFLKWIPPSSPTSSSSRGALSAPARTILLPSPGQQEAPPTSRPWTNNWVGFCYRPLRTLAVIVVVVMVAQVLLALDHHVRQFYQLHDSSILLSKEWMLFWFFAAIFPVFVIINIPLDCCCFIVLFLIVLTPSFCLWSLYEMWLKKKSLKICQ